MVTKLVATLEDGTEVVLFPVAVTPEEPTKVGVTDTVGDETVFVPEVA